MSTKMFHILSHFYAFTVLCILGRKNLVLPETFNALKYRLSKFQVSRTQTRWFINGNCIENRTNTLLFVGVVYGNIYYT